MWKSSFSTEKLSLIFLISSGALGLIWAAEYNTELIRVCGEISLCVMEPSWGVAWAIKLTVPELSSKDTWTVRGNNEAFIDIVDDDKTMCESNEVWDDDRDDDGNDDTDRNTDIADDDKTMDNVTDNSDGVDVVTLTDDIEDNEDWFVASSDGVGSSGNNGDDWCVNNSDGYDDGEDASDGGGGGGDVGGDDDSKPSGDRGGDDVVCESNEVWSTDRDGAGNDDTDSNTDIADEDKTTDNVAGKFDVVNAIVFTDDIGDNETRFVANSDGVDSWRNSSDDRCVNEWDGNDDDEYDSNGCGGGGVGGDDDSKLSGDDNGADDVVCESSEVRDDESDDDGNDVGGSNTNDDDFSDEIDSSDDIGDDGRDVNDGDNADDGDDDDKSGGFENTVNDNLDESCNEAVANSNCAKWEWLRPVDDDELSDNVDATRFTKIVPIEWDCTEDNDAEGDVAVDDDPELSPDKRNCEGLEDSNDDDDRTDKLKEENLVDVVNLSDE